MSLRATTGSSRTPPGSGDLEVSDGEHIRDLQLRFPNDERSFVRVKVLDPDGKPMYGADVRIDGIASEFTNAAGVAPVPSELAPGTSVTGKVKPADEHPALGGAPIRFVAEAPGYHKGLTTSRPDGSFLLQVPPFASGYLAVSKDGHATIFQTLSKDDTRRYQRLSLPAPGSLRIDIHWPTTKRADGSLWKLRIRVPQTDGSRMWVDWGLWKSRVAIATGSARPLLAA